MISLAPRPSLAATGLTKPRQADSDATQTQRADARWLLILRLLEDGWYIGPLHSAKPDGSCTCYRDAECPSTGKHPLTERGDDDKQHEIAATNDGKRLFALFARHPWANIGVALGPSKLLAVDNDTERGLIETAKNGLPPTKIRHGRMPAYLYRRSDDCPLYRLTHAGASSGFDVLTSGWLVVDGTHRTGAEVYTVGDTLEDAPAWAVKMLTDAAPKGSPTSTPAEPIDVEAERPIAEQALALLADWRADEYGAWVNVGMALSQLGDDGLELWDRWSQRSRKYKAGECARKWRTFTPGEGVRLGTLYWLCKQDSGTNPARGSLSSVQDNRTQSDPALLARIAELESLVTDLRGIIARKEAELAPLRDQVRELLALQRKPDKRERDSVLALLSEYESAKSRGQVDGDGFARADLGIVAENAGLSRPTVVAHGRMFATQTGRAEVDFREKGLRVIDRDTGEIRTLPSIYVRFNGDASEIRQAISAWEPERPKRGRPAGRACPKHPDADLILEKRWRCSVCNELVDSETTTEKAFRSTDSDEQPTDTEKAFRSDQTPTPETTQHHQSGSSLPVRSGTSEIEPETRKAESHPCVFCGNATTNAPVFDGRCYCDAHGLVPYGRVPGPQRGLPPRREEAPPPTLEDFYRDCGSAAGGGS